MTREPPSPEPATATYRIGDLGLRIAASFLMLWAPFFFFSAYRGHPVPLGQLVYSAMLFALPAVAIALVMGRRRGMRHVLVLALLVALFFDLQFSGFAGVVGVLTFLALVGVFWLMREHIVVILTAVFATILASTVLAPPKAPADTSLLTPAGATIEGAASLRDPRSETLVHLVLDEFAGIRGIPLEVDGGPELRREIEDFFGEYGFALHPSAFSEYPSSKHSIGSLLNFEASRHPKENFRGKRPYVLLRNRTFEILSERYSEIHVTQSNYMDFCSESEIPLTSCLTYRFDGSAWLEDAALASDAKLDVLLGMYFNMPGFFEFAAKTYVRTRNALLRIGIPLPALADWDGTVAPIAASVGFEHFRKTVLAAPNGTAHFGHLLIPHGPYVYDEACNLTSDPLGWLGPRPRHEKQNTNESRRIRYENYLPQVRCTLRQLREFFDELKAAGKWEGTTLILHGDHGARFYRTKLLERNRAQVTREDLADGYSTLFAIRSSGSAAGQEGIERLFADRASSQPVSRLLARALDAKAGEANAMPTVFLEGDDEWLEIEWSISESPSRR